MISNSTVKAELTGFMMDVNGTPVSVTLKHPIKIRAGRKIRLPSYLQETIQGITEAINE